MTTCPLIGLLLVGWTKVWKTHSCHIDPHLCCSMIRYRSLQFCTLWREMGISGEKKSRAPHSSVICNFRLSGLFQTTFCILSCCSQTQSSRTDFLDCSGKKKKNQTTHWKLTWQESWYYLHVYRCQLDHVYTIANLNSAVSFMLSMLMKYVH